MSEHEFILTPEDLKMSTGLYDALMDQKRTMEVEFTQFAKLHCPSNSGAMCNELKLFCCIAKCPHREKVGYDA